MPKIKINGREMEVEAGKTVLQAALDNDIYIPHYCYHPDLPISGNCRMCLVDIKPGPPKLSIACNTVVADGMEIDTENEKVQAARRAVMEFLLKNHPVDCPICDQAGECGLQDFYMKYDLRPSRLHSPELKVHKHKARKIGNNLVLDSERCILCTRCVRFMRDVVKDECLVIVNRRDHAEITTFPGKPVDNPYSLNLVEICPVGAWTSADFRFKQRVWFLEPLPSVCPMCARGCNIWLDRRGQEVFRMRGRRNNEINKTWLCDEGRLSYHAINDERLRAPRVDGAAATWDAALARAVSILAAKGKKPVVIVSGSLSLEEGAAALKLAESLSAKLLVHAGEPGWEDEFLRKSDKNSNLRGLSELGINQKLEGALGEDESAIYFETLCPNPLPDGVVPQVVVSPQDSPAVKSAQVALPAASYAESSGTVVNADGIRQSYAAALLKKGEAKAHDEVMNLVRGAAARAKKDTE